MAMIAEVAAPRTLRRHRPARRGPPHQGGAGRAGLDGLGALGRTQRFGGARSRRRGLAALRDDRRATLLRRRARRARAARRQDATRQGRGRGGRAARDGHGPHPAPAHGPVLRPRVRHRPRHALPRVARGDGLRRGRPRPRVGRTLLVHPDGPQGGATMSPLAPIAALLTALAVARPAGRARRRAPDGSREHLGRRGRQGRSAQPPTQAARPECGAGRRCRGVSGARPAGTRLPLGPADVGRPRRRGHGAGRPGVTGPAPGGRGTAMGSR